MVFVFLLGNTRKNPLGLGLLQSKGAPTRVREAQGEAPLAPVFFAGFSHTFSRLASLGKLTAKGTDEHR